MPDAPGPPAESLLLERPGVQVRRLHQIHSAMFAEECGGFGVTPVQYSLLTLVAAAPGLDQRGAAAGLRLDRFTTADVVRRLAEGGLLRVAPGADRRTRRLFLTARGAEVHAAMAADAGRAHDRLIAPLTERQRAQLMRMLRRLVDHHGAIVGAPGKIR